MTGINVVAAKQRLVEVLKSLLDGVQVTYSYVGKLADANRDYVYIGGQSSGQLQFTAFKDTDDGRVRRGEESTITLAIEVLRMGESTVETAEVRAVEIGEMVENYIARSTTFGDLPGLLKAVITGFKLTSFVEDGNAKTSLDYTITLTSDIR